MFTKLNSPIVSIFFSGKNGLKSMLLLTCLFVFSPSVFSQENYLPGYVVKNDNDTVRGFVDYRNWGKNPDKIAFKQSLPDASVLYQPADIREFKVKDEIYVSGIVDIEVSPIQVGRLSENAQMILKADTAFLQTLVKGRKSLLYYKNEAGREYFFIGSDSGFELLQYKKYLKQVEGQHVVVENKKFIGQLTLYLNDCAAILSKVPETSYNAVSLTKLFQHYYEHQSEDVLFQRNADKAKSNFGVVAGVSATGLKFESSGFEYLVDGGYNSSTKFSAGLFYDIILARNQEKWSVYNELLFTSFNVEGQYDEISDENYTTVTQTELAYSYLKLNNLIRFKYPFGNTFVFVNAGISNGFAIKETNYMKVETRFYTSDKVAEGKALDEARRYEQGLVFGTGLQRAKLSFELRMEKGNGISIYQGLKCSTTRLYLLLGYRF